jgi:putative ABC transport system ATP-binding protein
MTELTLENITYRYKGGIRNVVDSVSCTFESGKINAVVGPSGSGKTTLLSLMAGLDHPTQGSIHINGEDLARLDLDKYRRERVSMIFQAFQLFPLLTALENVCFPMELNGLSSKDAAGRARSFLVSVGIDEDKFRRYPANLSGGEQQRVAIARSLVSGARMLLADEPTGNLDKANGENVVEILQHLAHDQDYCVVIVTHDPAIAEKSDKVWHMSDGLLRETQ